MAPTHHRRHHAHPDLAERETEVLALLTADGGRITTGRRAIVRALLGGPDHHVTAEDVAALVQIDHPDVHLSTVYRTLEALERVGVVDRVQLGATGSGAVFHLTDHAHHHLVCDDCGSVTEVAHSRLLPLARKVADEHGFELASRHLALSGRCSACRR